VIEVPSVVGAAGAQPVPVAPLDPLLRGLIGDVSAYEELAVEAAVRGGRKRVLAAMLAHPLIGQYDLAGDLADRLIAENRAYLPWTDPAGAR
jgi:6-phospho-beta-glucosidase